MSRTIITIIIVILVITVSASIYSCTRVVIRNEPLSEFIYYASEAGLPAEYLDVINKDIEIQYRARPAYSSSTVYLTESFDDNGIFKQFYQLDSFEISSIFHEGFHAYVDLVVMAGKSSPPENESFNKIMESSLDYYTEASDGRKILWKNYRRQVSEEAMAIHITNLIKYKIVYEKQIEKVARNYIYGLIDKKSMEEETLLINKQWQEIQDGNRSRGYYNKSFLRWKLPHIIDAKNHISIEEINFVTDFILPGIGGRIEIPPLTDFIKGCKTDDLPQDFLIQVNKNNFWEDGFELEAYNEMSPERISQVYIMAFDIYWDKILKRDLGIRIDEMEDFQRMVEAARKWYTGSINEPEKIESIIKNAASEYIGNIIYEKIRWQDEINDDLLGIDDIDSVEFKKSWKDAIEGSGIRGFYIDDGVVIKNLKAMTLDEKEFIIKYILPDINYSFSPLIVTGPIDASGEIIAEAGVFSSLINTGDSIAP